MLIKLLFGKTKTLGDLDSCISNHIFRKLKKYDHVRVCFCDWRKGLQSSGLLQWMPCSSSFSKNNVYNKDIILPSIVSRKIHFVFYFPFSTFPFSKIILFDRRTHHNLTKFCLEDNNSTNTVYRMWQYTFVLQL